MREVKRIFIYKPNFIFILHLKSISSLLKMEKSFEMKMDEDIPDDGWGRHRIDDEVLSFCVAMVCFSS